MAPITDRRTAGALSVALLAAVVAPVRQHWCEQPRDGFPLSCYPMFTAVRPATVREHHVVGVDARGRRRPLPHGWVGPGGGNQVRRQLNRAVRAGEADAVARRAAGEVARRGAAVVAVEVVTSTYRLDDFCAGRREPERRRVRASAPVPRPVAT